MYSRPFGVMSIVHHDGLLQSTGSLFMGQQHNRSVQGLVSRMITLLQNKRLDFRRSEGMNQKDFGHSTTN